MSDNLILKPKFILSEQILILGLIPLAVFALPIASASWLIISAKAMLWSLIAPALIGLIIIVFVVVKIPFVAKTYNNTYFNFGPTSMSYVESFLNYQEKTIDYRDILEVNLVRGVLDKAYGLGTIILSTAAVPSHGNPTIGGIRVFDVTNPEESYRQIKQLVEVGKKIARQAPPPQPPQQQTVRQPEKISSDKNQKLITLIYTPRFEPILMLMRAVLWIIGQSLILFFIGISARKEFIEVFTQSHILKAAIVLGGINFLILFSKFMSYRNSKYILGGENLEYAQGFLTMEEKIVDLADIREVNLRKSVLQQMFGLGTVYLSTAASNLNTGLRFVDLENPEDAYQVIRLRVEKRKQFASRV